MEKPITQTQFASVLIDAGFSEKRSLEIARDAYSRGFLCGSISKYVNDALAHALSEADAYRKAAEALKFRNALMAK